MESHLNRAIARSRRTNLIIAVVLTGVVVVAGIGYAVVSNNPSIKVARALANSFSTSTVALSAHVSPEILAAAGLSDSSVADAEIADFTSLKDVSAAIDQLTVEFSSETSRLDTTVENAGIRVRYGTNTLITLAVIERIAYLQTDVALMASRPHALLTRQDIERVLAGFSDGPNGMATAITALKAGKPIAISMAKGTALGDLYDQSFVTNNSPANQNQQNKLGQALMDALADSVTVTPDGADAQGDVYDISINLQSFLSKLGPAIDDGFGEYEVAGLRLDQTIRELRKTSSNNPLRLRAWLKDDLVNKIALDLTSVLAPRSTVPAWSGSATLSFRPVELDPPANAIDVTNLAELLLNA